MADDNRQRDAALTPSDETVKRLQLLHEAALNFMVSANWHLSAGGDQRTYIGSTNAYDEFRDALRFADVMILNDAIAKEIAEEEALEEVINDLMHEEMGDD